MNASLFLASTALAYSDSSGLPSQNPTTRYFDWGRMRTVGVDDPLDQPFINILPGASVIAFNGARATAIDGTTQFAVALNGLGTAYRFTHAGGTAPAFKTDRALALNTQTATLTANLNGTLTFASSGVNPLLALQPNDLVFIPGLTTGDTAGPFSPANEGLWVVLAANAGQATLQRPVGTDFSGVTETVAVTANGQVLGFAADGVQIGDKIDITAGFVPQTRRTFAITQVTPKWFEVVSTLALPPETQAPGATGMQFYSSLKRWVRVEADQECAIQFNGDTGVTNRISPFVAGDKDGTGYLEKWGSTYALTLVNRSSVPMRARVWSVA